MKVAFRADASPAIGVGHVRRCLSLAKALAGMGAEVVLAGIGVSDFGSGVAVATLKSGDPDAFRAAVGQADWTVVDHYGLAADWHQAIGGRVAVIDDLADRPLACDLLIDHNLRDNARADYTEVLTQPARVLSGPRFALIDPGFAEAPPAPVDDEVASIGVFLGGADAAGVTGIVLNALERCRWRGKVEVAITSTNPHLPALAARAGATLSVDLPDLAGFFGRHGLQIGAAGGASWERCCLGAPTLAVAVAANQQVVIGPLVERGGVEGHGAWPVNPDLLARQIDELVDDRARRAALAAAGRALVDGHGAMRVAARMMSLSLRPATADDAMMSFGWRNAESTRRFSGDPAPLDPAAHREWWAAALADPARKLLVAMLGTRPAGVLRYDRAGESAEVSIYLDPLLTGIGLGVDLLRAGNGQLDGVTCVTARIDSRNTGSLRSFAEAGFVAAGDDRYVARLGSARQDA